MFETLHTYVAYVLSNLESEKQAFGVLPGTGPLHPTQNTRRFCHLQSPTCWGQHAKLLLRQEPILKTLTQAPRHMPGAPKKGRMGIGLVKS